MKPRRVRGLLVCVVTVLAASAAEAQEKPNIVVIMTDNQGYGDLGCYGGLRAEKARNYERAEPMIREAAGHGARIVCTTECFLDGYAIADKTTPLETYRALGEPIP